MLKKELINSIIVKISKESPFNIPTIRKNLIFKLIEETVNGDHIIDSIILSAKISKTIDGILCFILTNTKIIKISLDENNTESSSWKITDLNSIERKIIDGKKAEINLLFSNDGMGLRYPIDNEDLNKFFKKIDLAR